MEQNFLYSSKNGNIDDMEKIDNHIFMQMSPNDFDQSPDGWRSLVASRNYVEAANLIKEYVMKNKERIDDLEIMYFHIGQLLASAGHENFSEALEAFKLSFQMEDAELWNAYVSATIGFIEGDMRKIDEAILTIENSSDEDKRSGNLDIVKNFKKAIEVGERNYEKVYSQPTEVISPM